MNAARVVVFKEATLLREGLVLLLEQAGLEVAAATGTAEEFLAQLGSAQPDLGLIGMHSRKTNGLNVLREARRRHPAIPILVLSLDSDPLARERALEAGAAGFLDEMEDPPARLLNALYAALGIAIVREEHALL